MATQRTMRKVGDSSNKVNIEEIRKALEEADSCENEITALNKQASDEQIKVVQRSNLLESKIKQKYNLLRSPIYRKRNESLNKIPHFWVTAFVNHSVFSTILCDSEKDCLHHLHKIEVEENEDTTSGFKISFYFEENLYFENRILTKEYLESLEEPPSKSTPINWKEGFDLTQAENHQSFFSWFNNHNDSLYDDILEIIKDDIYINPLRYLPKTNVRKHNDKEIRKALVEAYSCENEITALKKQERDEERMIVERRNLLTDKIEQKYNLLKRPIYQKRNESLSKIPHFWVTAFVNHPVLSTILSDSEKVCLHHLRKIDVEERDPTNEYSGSKISFYFEVNPYFDNRILTKEYLGSLEEPPSKSTPIKWKEGFDLTQAENNPSKPGQKCKTEHQSFFSWFNDHNERFIDDIYEIIRYDIYSKPLQYFYVPEQDQEEDGDDQGTGITGDTDETNETKHNDEEIQKVLEEVDSCKNEIDAVIEQASDEKLKVEQKYK